MVTTFHTKRLAEGVDNMAKYHITIEVTQEGQEAYTKSLTVSVGDKRYAPRIGDGVKKLMYPPIYERIISVTEIGDEVLEEIHGNGD
jgi:hypothetical protein